MATTAKKTTEKKPAAKDGSKRGGKRERKPFAIRTAALFGKAKAFASALASAKGAEDCADDAKSAAGALDALIKFLGEQSADFTARVSRGGRGGPGLDLFPGDEVTIKEGVAELYGDLAFDDGNPVALKVLSVNGKHVWLDAGDGKFAALVKHCEKVEE